MAPPPPTVLRSDVAFSRWDPVRDLLALHELQLGQLGQIGQLVGTDAPGWTPPVDLYETSGAFVLSAELPGLDRDAIDIMAEESRITIRGSRASGLVPCEQFHRVERGHGAFSRTFVLSEAIDIEQVAAEFKDGVLTVTIPKAGGRGARRIDVL